MQTILCEILVGVYFVNWSFGGGGGGFACGMSVLQSRNNKCSEYLLLM